VGLGHRPLGLLVVLISIAPPLAALSSAATVFDRYLEVRRLYSSNSGETESAHRSRIRHGYKTFLGSAQSHANQASDEDLHVLLRAAVQAGVYGQTARFLHQALTDLNELASRGQAADRDYVEIYRALVYFRMFTEAGAIFRGDHVEGMEALPDIIDRVGALRRARTEYQVMNDRDELVRQVSVLPKTGIVVIAHPLCHFSLDAVDAIHHDPVLGPIFRDHSKWLAPPDQLLSVREFQEWNEKYPEAVLSIAYRENDWQIVDEWATPTFYFFRDGRLIRKVGGWHGDTSELSDGLRSLGLINASVGKTRPLAESSSEKMASPNGTAQQELDQHSVDLATAPIRSRENLDTYLHTTPIVESPFQYLSLVDQKIFLTEVVFDEGGVASFPTDVFEGLTVTQAYEVLALFGWQAVVPALPGLRVGSAVDPIGSHR
jgi:hypothetical protein